MKYLKSLALSCFLLPSTTLAADVLITTDISKGQGFFYEHNNTCYVVTPEHVIENATSISLLTSSRQTYNATVEKVFEVDLALLKSDAPSRECKGEEFTQVRPLASLLKIYEEGVLKTKLDDGSTIQTKVDIVGVDDTEFLQIRPQKGSDKLKQGYSGSVLFVANQPSGTIIEIDEGSGFVYRSDALTKLLHQTFKIETAKPKVSPEFSGSHKGRLAKGQVEEFKLNLQGNSPIEIQNVPTMSSVDYYIRILDSHEKALFKDDTRSTYDKRFAFTPPHSGTYTLQLEGKSKNQGAYHLKINQWSLDSQLRGEGNILEIGDEIEGGLARRTIAEYKFSLSQNSPIEIQNIPTKQSVDYYIRILDSRGKPLFKNDTRSTYDKRFAFTPPKTGTYTLQLEGKSNNHGVFRLKINQWSMDANLRGEGNILEVGDEVKGALARKSVAEYKLALMKNSPIEMQNIPSEQSVDYYIRILDGRGKVLFKNDTRSTYDKRFAFTPPKNGTYTLQLEGKSKNHGSYRLKFNQWSLDSQLRGEGNNIQVGDEVEGALARKTIAEYKLALMKNSPIEMQNIPSEQSVDYYIRILDGRGKVLFKNDTRSTYDKRFAYTPPKNGTYTLQLEGKSNTHGAYHLRINQWSLDSQLRGEGNVLELGDEIEGALARKTIAEYKLALTQNSPIEVQNIPSEQSVDYYIRILDRRGKVVFKNDTRSTYDKRFTFSPPNSGYYTLQLEGKSRSHGTFYLKIWDASE